MVENNLGAIFNRVKTVTKQAADATARQAKLARLRINLMTLHGERSRFLQNIGSQVFVLYKQNKTFDQLYLFSQLRNDITAIEDIDRRVEATEAQIEAQEGNIEVRDITPQ